MFGEMLQDRGVQVSFDLARPDERRTRQQVLSVLRSHFRSPSPDRLSILYYSGHGIAGRDADGTKGALCIGSVPADVSELSLEDLRAQTTRLPLVGHRGHKRTYVEALERERLLTLDDCLRVWEEVRQHTVGGGGAVFGGSRGARLLIVADSCYSGKLISRLRSLPRWQLAQLNVAIQSAGNARQTVAQASGFSHRGRVFDSSGCLTAYLTAKQEENARVRWSWPAQHPQFYCTWDLAAADKPSVALELGGGYTLRTYNKPADR